MACSAKGNCIVRGNNELYVRCWLCKSEFHAKCANISKFVADAIKGSGGKVLFCCDLCIPVKEETAKVHIQCQSAFSNVKKGLENLIKDLATNEEAFKNFSILKKPIESLIHKNSDQSFKDKATGTPTPASVGDNPTNSGSSIKSPKVTPEVIVVDTSSSASNQSNSGPLPSNSGTLGDRPKKQKPKFKELVGIPTRKTLYLYKVHRDTKSSDIINYISNKFPNRPEIEVSQLKFKKPRSTASFKLFIPLDLVDSLLNLSFWPKFIAVKEFEYHEKAGSFPKN